MSVCVVQTIFGLEIGPLSKGHHERVTGKDHDSKLMNGNQPQHYIVYFEKINIHNQVHWTQIVTHIYIYIYMFVCLLEVLNNKGISSSLSDSKLKPQQSSDKSWTPAEESEGLSTAVKQATASLHHHLESIMYPGCRLFHM